MMMRTDNLQLRRVVRRLATHKKRIKKLVATEVTTSRVSNRRTDWRKSVFSYCLISASIGLNPADADFVAFADQATTA